MKRRNLIILAVVTVLAVAAVPFLHAQPHGRGVHAGPGGPGDNLGPLGRLVQAKEQLGLSDQQVDEIKAIFGSLREQNEQYRDQLRTGHEAIMSTLIQNPANVAAAQALIDQQTQAERALKMNLLNAASKALSVLTAEQRTKLAAMIEEHKSAMPTRRGR